MIRHVRLSVYNHSRLSLVPPKLNLFEKNVRTQLFTCFCWMALNFCRRTNSVEALNETDKASFNELNEYLEIFITV